MTTPPAAPTAIDLTGLDQLRRRAARDDPAALAEAAVQFEALFIGMMLDSARSANFGGGLLDGPETDQYLELMDRQVALDMARHGGLGFGKMLLEQLTPGAQARPQGAAALLAPRSATTDASVAPTPEDFVARLLPEANEAAAALGVEPRLLLAQAALETGWGGAVPRADGGSASNLFGIKAGAAWPGRRVAAWTLEHRGGAAEPERAEFRAYSSTAASFADYVDLISGTPRYANALAHAGDPEAYARAISAAGYATDPEYADKWLAIYRGGRLDGALRTAEARATDQAIGVPHETGL